jgi:hypothetical protein
MERIHFENVMLQVLAMEMVHDWIPATNGTPVLLGYLDHERVETRRAAIYFLGFYPAPEKPARLLKALDDEKTRNAALRTLGKWKVDRARDEMRALLKKSEPNARACWPPMRCATSGIPMTCPPAGRPERPHVHRAQYGRPRRGLVWFGKAHRPLLRELRDSEGAGRRQIVRLLGELEVVGAVRPLRRLLNARPIPDCAPTWSGRCASWRARLKHAADQTDAEPLFVVP